MGRLVSHPAIITAILAALSSSTAATAANAADGPPPGLTTRGRLLWNLDALLYDRFGRQGACIIDGSIEPGSKCERLSLAEYVPYFFTFANARKSSFLLVRRATAPRSGMAHPVRVLRRYVRCAVGRLLVRGDRFSQLECAEPL
jgi:hypothetical protein